MHEGLIDKALQYVPGPIASIVALIALAVIVQVVYYAKLTPQVRRDLWNRRWRFVLTIAIGVLAVAAYAFFTSRPSPKASGIFRLVVAGGPAPAAGYDLSFAVASSIQQLVQSLHIERKVEVVTTRPLGAPADAEETARARGADALLWVATTGGPGNSGTALYPELYLLRPDWPCQRIRLRTREWRTSPAFQFTAIALQVGLETLDTLEPILPDWNGEIPGIETHRRRDYDKIATSAASEQPVRLTLTAYLWRDEPGVVKLSEMAKRMVTKSVRAPVTFETAHKDGRAERVTTYATLTWHESPLPSEFPSHITYALWAYNNSNSAEHSLQVSSKLVPGLIYVKGMLTANGLPVPDTGNVAEVDRKHGEIHFSISTLGPGERFLAASTFLIPGPTGPKLALSGKPLISSP